MTVLAYYLIYELWRASRTENFRNNYIEIHLSTMSKQDIEAPDGLQVWIMYLIKHMSWVQTLWDAIFEFQTINNNL